MALVAMTLIATMTSNVHEILNFRRILLLNGFRWLHNRSSSTNSLFITASTCSTIRFSHLWPIKVIHSYIRLAFSLPFGYIILMYMDYLFHNFFNFNFDFDFFDFKSFLRWSFLRWSLLRWSSHRWSFHRWNFFLWNFIRTFRPILYLQFEFSNLILCFDFIVFKLNIKILNYFIAFV